MSDTSLAGGLDGVLEHVASLRKYVGELPAQDRCVLEPSVERLAEAIAALDGEAKEQARQNEALRSELAKSGEMAEALREARAELQGRAAQLERTVDALESEVQLRQITEEEYREVNRALKVLRACSHALVRAEDESDFLNRICRICTEVGQYRLAWVGFCEHDEAKLVRPVAQAGFEEGYLERARITWADMERGRGPTGRAIRSRDPVIAQNIQTDPDFEPWRGDAVRRGYASAIALPLARGRQVLGALNIYSDEPDAFDEAELELLKELADDVAFGIGVLRTRRERERAEAGLRQSEERFRELAELLPETVFETDLDGRFTFVNQSALRASGYTPEDVARGMNLLDVLGRQDRRRAIRNMAAILRGEAGGPQEYTVVRKDGSRFPALAYTSPIIREGRPAGVRGIAVDITERKQAMAELSRSNELLERTFSSIHLLVAYMDTEFNFVQVNRAYAEADGRDPDFFVGRNHFDLYPNAENEAIFREVVRTGVPYTAHEKPFVYAEHPERGVTYWDWRLQPVRGPDGATIGVVLSLLNVTQRKKAQQELEAERRRLYDVLNMLPGIVYLLAADHSVRFANQRFAEVFGEPGQRPCHAILYGRAEPCQTCPTMTVLQTGQTRSDERTFANGRTYQCYDYPFADADGTSLVLRLGIDVTDHKRLEREIAETSAREQRRIGQDLHDVLGQHLTGIAFLAKVLANRLQARSLREAGEAAEIATLVNQAIQQTRALARGLCPVDLTAEGLVSALKEFAANVQTLFDSKCRLECPEPILIHDNTVATHLYHIAQEAVNNAVKHGKAKNIAVALAETDGRVTLEVKDDGVGMSRHAQGGMGLRIMSHRASIIGGSLTVQSEAGRGTTVTCTLAKPQARPTSQ